MADEPNLIARPIPPRDMAEARILLRGCRSATLATLAGFQPHTALVTPACMPDGSILLLLSELSRHTVDLRGNPVCSVLCQGPMPGSAANPQTVPRLSLSCVAEPDRSPDALKRYLALHPYAELYAGFGDFAAWRLHIKDVQFVGGFARAWSATADAFLPAPAAVNDVAATEAAALAHCNHDHASSMAAIGQAHGGFQGSWTLAAVDVDGCNLMCGERGIYVPWLRPVTDGGSLHHAIVELSQAAREICQN